MFLNIKISDWIYYAVFLSQTVVTGIFSWLIWRNSRIGNEIARKSTEIAKRMDKRDEEERSEKIVNNLAYFSLEMSLCVEYIEDIFYEYIEHILFEPFKNQEEMYKWNLWHRLNFDVNWKEKLVKLISFHALSQDKVEKTYRFYSVMERASKRRDAKEIKGFVEDLAEEIIKEEYFEILQDVEFQIGVLKRVEKTRLEKQSKNEDSYKEQKVIKNIKTDFKRYINIIKKDRQVGKRIVKDSYIEMIEEIKKITEEV